jgi:hypothetical protein
MGFMRIYTDDRGETHFEDLDFPTGGMTMPAGELMLRYHAPRRLVDWHPISRPMYYVTLSGEAEITVSDGETRHIGPGNVTLCEDTTGKGHRTQMIGPGPRLCLAVTVD